MSGKFKSIFSYTYICVILIALFNVPQLEAQELNCNVSVIHPQIQQTNTQVFKSLENSIREFMNGRRWSNDKYLPQEKIDCSILINITAVNGTDYSGTIQVVSNRPVYGTNYTTTMLNLLDKSFNFSYVEFQPMDFQEGTYINELTSVLGYYAYLILGYDYDSYSEFGGTQHFNKAMNIVNGAQASAASGWGAMEKNERNRYFIITRLLEDRNSAYRKAWYQYHRHGLDIMYSDNEKALNTINQSLELISGVHGLNPNQHFLRMFFDVKGKELAELFSQAQASQKYKAKDMLRKMDVTNASLYDEKLK